MSDAVTRLRRHRYLFAASFDGAAWIIAFLAATGLRYGDQVTPWGMALVFGVVAAILHVAIGSLTRLHWGRSRTASLEEMMLLGGVTFLVGVTLFLADLAGHWIARTVPFTATMTAVVITAAGRALWRRALQREFENSDDSQATPVLLAGAGAAARDLIDSMLEDPSRRWRPVAMIDDDPAKRFLRFRGVPVRGKLKDLANVARESEVDHLIIAIPSASAREVAQIRRKASEAGLEVKVLPATTELLDGNVGIRDIRDINLGDVLGRHQIDTNIGDIADYLRGKRVLVTGAGGSIGSELCRQIDRFDPELLMMLDRDESALHAVQLSLQGRALLDSEDVILNDIRDLDALRAIFRERRPQVVFHAAALKHLPMLEQFPAEAVKTNVLGTRNVLQAAREVGVETFVNVSTDKAANPSSVLGYSKRIAERITADFAQNSAGGTYLSVRFGNVLGSRGSVLTAFAKQIAGGGPVTVTHKDVTRYFMTIEEACQLVVQAAAIGEPGEALVLDMGEPIRIMDVAKQLIAQSGKTVEIEITGLRPGEKMHEELFADDEPQDVRPRHELVSHVPVPPIENTYVESLPTTGPSIEVIRELASHCLPSPGMATTPTERL